MVTDQSTERRLGRLRIWNIVVGLILAVQAVMIAVFTNNFSLPVTATFMSGPPGTAPELYHWFNISTGSYSFSRYYYRTGTNQCY